MQPRGHSCRKEQSIEEMRYIGQTTRERERELACMYAGKCVCMNRCERQFTQANCIHHYMDTHPQPCNIQSGVNLLAVDDFG